jgi:polysaccharide export outer membrane protein
MEKTYIKQVKKLFLLIGIISLFSSCISPKETNLLQPGREPYYSMKPFEDYRLQVYDEIYCNILSKNTDFTKEYESAFSGIISTTGNVTQNSYVISSTGNISVPLFGDIKIEGLTIPEAETVIQRKMRSSFPDAQVRVRLKNNLFYVMSGSRSGTYALYKDNMTIYQALSISGNVSDEIDLSKVSILRKDKAGNSTIKTFNLKTESVIESEYYYIRPNDVIYYSTSNSSFFRVRSFTELFATILTPITFLISMLVFIPNNI